MKLTALLLLLAFPAFAADPPTDAPLSVHLQPGQTAPYEGQLVPGTEAEYVDAEKQATDDHTFRKKAMTGIRLEPAALVGIIAGALAVGAAVSAGVIVATKK